MSIISKVAPAADKLKAVFGNGSGRALLHLQKASPQLLIGAGVVGFAATVYLASRQTLKLEAVVDKNKVVFDAIKEDMEANEDISKREHTQKLAMAYLRFGADIATLYSVPLLIGSASLACFIGSHRIMAGRNAAALAAYTLADESYRRYRERVVAEHGEEKDRFYASGYVEKEDEVENEDGTVSVRKRVHREGHLPSKYARFFDQTSVAWKSDASLNLYTLRTEQDYANDMLRARGHVFLNEVYDRLGIPRTSEGSIVGWVRSDNPSASGDGYIDFGIYDPENLKAREFVNGYEKSILLDFNVDGVIYDLI